jgi:hypothetical protein
VGNNKIQYRFGHGAGVLHLKTPAFFISRSRKEAFGYGICQAKYQPHILNEKLATFR